MDFLGIDLGPPLTRLYGGIPEHGSLERLTGDASTRTYYRLRVPDRDPSRAVVMHLPEDALRSDEGDTGSRPSELPFVAVQRLLETRGVRVPRVYADEVEHRVLILEDLGDQTFEQVLMSSDPSTHDALYSSAVDGLVSLHNATDAPEPGHLAFGRGFDLKLLRWELDHFREWGLEAVNGPLVDQERRNIDRLFDTWAFIVGGLPQRLVHRDYQSRNLMWHDDEWVVIDFQDALMGPTVYDLVALLCDSYVDIPLARQEAMVQRYAEARGQNPEQLLQEFWLVTVQRKLKDAGRFVFIDRKRDNPRFLEWFPRSLMYVGRALRALEDGTAPSTELFSWLEGQIEGFPDQVPVPDSSSPRGGGTLPCRTGPGE